jgi:hypothetical protein
MFELHFITDVSEGIHLQDERTNPYSGMRRLQRELSLLSSAVSSSGI